MEDDLISIGEAAAKFGMTVSALRYWDECGLAAPAERRGGRRWYGPAELHRIALIRIMQETGLMSLDEIKDVLAAAPDWRGTVAGRIEAIGAQIERLTTGRAYLEHLLTCPRDDPAGGCPHLREATRTWIEDGIPFRA
ncbi:MerR family transcriptional regulator [Actinomadura rudentiformis]|nr:MerR family transcriptional regulator [Actinomadura rudentiformis]